MTDGVNDRMEEPVPTGLVEQLSTAPREIRTAEVARARRRAVARCYDNGDVVEEIATQLLRISTVA